VGEKIHALCPFQQGRGEGRNQQSGKTGVLLKKGLVTREEILYSLKCLIWNPERFEREGEGVGGLCNPCWRFGVVTG